MRRKHKDGIQWLEFELLADIPNLVHAVFLRHGGVSQGPFASLNMGLGTSDNPVHVRENRKRVKSVLSVDRLISASQVHSDRVVHIDTPDPLNVGKADGLITQIPDIGLMIEHADCQAAIFYDPQHRALANVHAGWRGNVQNIYAKTIGQMRDAFGTSPQDLLVCISPSLGPNWGEFKHYREELPEQFWKFQVQPTYFDLWAIARMQLEECGVLPEHIECASICTRSHPEDFFSYRREKIHGNHATIAALVS